MARGLDRPYGAGLWLSEYQGGSANAAITAIGRALVAQEEPEPEYSLHFV
jgi:hypothetical protein